MTSGKMRDTLHLTTKLPMYIVILFTELRISKQKTDKNSRKRSASGYLLSASFLVTILVTENQRHAYIHMTQCVLETDTLTFFCPQWGHRVVRSCWLNFQCRDVLLI